MKLTHALASFCLALSLSAPAHAENDHRLMPDTLNLEIVDGSIVPDDCMYPASITDTTRFEIACVTMPAIIGQEISSQYIGQLGAQGWHQGSYVPGGMTAVRTDENNCRRVLNIFPSNYPPSNENADINVLWFALDRTPRCNESQAG
ncbi:MAG: hypothetical protein NT015_12020 [Alphaproteobacteria bacterium]|nr:hypothetical protein [Alphaproteobacteria bacterium]